MSKLYGLGNYVITEIGTTLMSNNEFNKFVYYTNISSEQYALEQEDLESPIELLTEDKEIRKRKVFLWRRVPSEKVQDIQDVNIFISLLNSTPNSENSKRLKTLYISIGFVVQESCSVIGEGDRSICLISAIEKILENKKLAKGLGNCRIMESVALIGLPSEYIGYEVVCKVDGITETVSNSTTELNKNE